MNTPLIPQFTDLANIKNKESLPKYDDLEGKSYKIPSKEKKTYSMKRKDLKKKLEFRTTLLMETTLPLPSTTTSSPPSCSSSPTHDFSFTISFQTSPRCLSSLTSTAIDLSPADEIFFHGHLLPLQLLSHLPPPPLPPPPPTLITKTNNNSIESNKEKTPKSTSKPFYSLFGTSKGKTRRLEEEEGEKKKKKPFDVGKILKKYTSLIEALLFSRASTASKEKREVRKRPYSFSGRTNSKGREEWMERRRKRYGQAQFSAPASMRTSPTDSGILLATMDGGFGGCGSSSDESTMEELQNAIQAAIAHCKNSIALKEEEKCKI